MIKTLNNIAMIFFFTVSIIINGAQPPDEGWVEIGSADAYTQPEKEISFPHSEIAMLAENSTSKAIGAIRKPISSINGTDIYMAAWEGNKDRVCQLINEDPTIVNTNSYGWTPLHSAVLRDQLETVRLLISAKANLDARYCFVDTNGMSRNLFGGESERKRKIEQFEPRLAIEYDLEAGATPLFLAAKLGFSSIVEELIGAGADIERPDEKGRTPLVTAIEHGNFDATKTLLANGANPNAQTSSRWEAPILLAAEHGYTTIAQLLVDYKANVDIQNCVGTTPLLCATTNDHHEVVNLLLKAGANGDLQSDSRNAPLLEAARRHNTNIIQALVAAKVNSNISDSVTGISPLHIVAHDGNVEAVKLLLSGGADPNYESGWERLAPLDLVVGVGYEYICGIRYHAGLLLDGSVPVQTNAKHIEIAQILIAAGAKLERTGRCEKYPLHFATSPIWAKLINGYKKQIACARQQAKSNAKSVLYTLALGLQQRVGKESSLRHISPDLLQHNLAPLVVTALEDQAEYEARQQRPTNGSSCVIS